MSGLLGWAKPSASSWSYAKNQFIYDTSSRQGLTQVHRFAYRPINDVEKRLSSNISDLKTEVGGLDKKLHYLETTYKNSREHIEKIIRGGNARS